MYVLRNTDTDGYYYVFDIGDNKEYRLTEKSLIRLAKKSGVLGVCAVEDELLYAVTQCIHTFATESEADEYFEDMNPKITFNGDIHGYWYVIVECFCEPIFIPYLVGYYTEVETTYVSKFKGYTPYKSDAKRFTKSEANKLAGVMRSKGTRNWRVIRLKEDE